MTNDSLLRLPTDSSPNAVEAKLMQVRTTSPLDELAGALDASDWLLSRAKSIDQLARSIAIEWIDVNGEFDIGDQHYSVGYATTTTCKNVSLTAHAVLQAVGGDIEQLLATLVAQPFKHGTVRSHLDQASYASLFRASRTGRLVHGIPERNLKRGNRLFIKNS